MAFSLIAKSVLNKFKTEMLYIGRNTRSITNSIVSQSNKKETTKPVLTIQEVKDKLNQIMGVKRGYKPIQESRSHLLQYLPKSQAELEPRSMQDSFTSALIPLSTDAELQDRYITFLGSVRFGRLLEDMDMFSVWVVQMHIKNPLQKPGIPSPYMTVTALVDQIDFTGFQPTPSDDIRLSGHVSWVGKSSVEVVIWLEQMRHNQWHKLTRALFLMALRNPTNTGPAIVNAIQPANEKEKQIFSGGETRKKRRYQVQSQSLLKVIPSNEEQKIIHDLFIRSMAPTELSMLKRTLPPGCVWMENATLSNIIFSHPENRNCNEKVFGGFLMRQAVELSWALAYLYSKCRPELKHISDINFHKPIEVNCLIRMTAHVVYTQKQIMQVTVYAESYEAKTALPNTTNEFHFTYELNDVAPEVYPMTYYEAMMYLDGRRHFLRAVSQKVADSTITK